MSSLKKRCDSNENEEMTEILHKCAEQSNTLCYILRHQPKCAKHMQLFPGVMEPSPSYVPFNPEKA